MTRTARLSLLIGLFAVCLPATGFGAGLLGPKKTALEKLEDGDAIRNRFMLRGGRFELSPGLGFTMNDAFQRTALLGAQMHYHISDSFALGVAGYYGISFNSDLADRIEEARPERADGGAFTTVGLIATLEITYTPLIGKFALFGRTVFNYDLHLIAGVGGVQTAGDTDLEGFNIAPVLGIGLRTFIQDNVSINVQLRDYLYASSLNAVPTEEGNSQATESSFSNNFALMIGAGFYFPGKPEIDKGAKK